METSVRRTRLNSAMISFSLCSNTSRLSGVTFTSYAFVGSRKSSTANGARVIATLNCARYVSFSAFVALGRSTGLPLT